MSLFTYNSVQLPLPRMSQFERRAVYEGSNTDWYCTRFDIRLQCLLNTAYLNISANGGPTLSNPAEIMNTLWTLLMTPRKGLSYMVGGVEMIPAIQNGSRSATDAINGPQPQFCNIIQITPTTFVIDYNIVAHYWQNNPSDGTNTNNTANPVLYNRWTEQVTIDEMMISTRTRKGILRIRSDNTNGYTPDILRSALAVVSIPANFIRQASQYKVSEDGLTLSYQIVDREVFKMPPSPAFKAEGIYTDLGTGAQAAYREGIVRVKLFGAPSTDQSQLFNAAFTIAAEKMQANLGQPITLNITSQGSVAATKLLKIPLYTEIRRSVWLYDNIVEIEARAMLNFAQGRKAGMPFGFDPMTFTPGSDNVPTAPPPYRDRGSANLLLQAAAYWDPNAVNNTRLIPGVPTTNINAFTSVTPQGGSSPKYAVPGILPGTSK